MRFLRVSCHSTTAACNVATGVIGTVLVPAAPPVNTRRDSWHQLVASATKGVPHMAWLRRSVDWLGRGASVGHTAPQVIGVSAANLTAMRCARRFVQFEQTSETLRGINKASSTFTSKASAEKHKKTAAKWITKSTKDYITEADRDSGSKLAMQVNPVKERYMQRSSARKERFTAIHEETDRIFEGEMDRMRADGTKRWRKGVDFFKRQGLAFTVLYIAVYGLCLAVLYIGFSTGWLKKETAYEFMFFILGGYVNKERFYDRVEAWDTYIDLGFAFVINEMLEIFRLPFMIYTFYTFRPLLTGVSRRFGGRGSIFRMNAVES